MFMEEVLLEKRARCSDCGTTLTPGETDWKLSQLLFADDAVLLATSEEEGWSSSGRGQCVWERSVGLEMGDRAERWSSPGREHRG